MIHIDAEWVQLNISAAVIGGLSGAQPILM
jgi:hypothetical protein